MLQFFTHFAHLCPDFEWQQIGRDRYRVFVLGREIGRVCGEFHELHCFDNTNRSYRISTMSEFLRWIIHVA